MRTSVDIKDVLLEKVKKLGAQKGWTLRLVIEEALSQYLKRELDKSDKPFKLKKGSVGGSGLSADYADGWSSIRESIYSGRGE